MLSENLKSDVRNAIFEAAVSQCESEIANAIATIKIYSSNPAGVGEHPGIVEEVLKAAEQGASAQEKLEFLKEIHS